MNKDMNTRNGKKRITLHISDEAEKILKKAAIDQDKTLSDFIEQVAQDLQEAVV